MRGSLSSRNGRDLPAFTKVAVLVVSLLVLAGCSTAGAKNDYVDTVNEIQLDAQDAFTATTSSVPDSKEELVTILRDGEAALADAVTKLEEVDVPSDAEAGHPDLVAGIDKLRRLFAKTAADVESKSDSAAFAAVQPLGTKGSEIGSEIDSAIRRINKDIGAAE